MGLLLYPGRRSPSDSLMDMGYGCYRDNVWAAWSAVAPPGAPAPAWSPRVVALVTAAVQMQHAAGGLGLVGVEAPTGTPRLFCSLLPTLCTLRGRASATLKD